MVEFEKKLEALEDKIISSVCESKTSEIEGIMDSINELMVLVVMETKAHG